MGTKCILRGNEMQFVGSKSLNVSLCPLPGSVQFCIPIIHQFKPENSFDSVQIVDGNKSLNNGGVKIICHKINVSI